MHRSNRASVEVGGELDQAREALKQKNSVDRDVTAARDVAGAARHRLGSNSLVGWLAGM